MHEVTRRLLGVLLRELDGFSGGRSVVIAATNRKQDLDPALLSRFDTCVDFPLPDAACRCARARACVWVGVRACVRLFGGGGTSCWSNGSRGHLGFIQGSCWDEDHMYGH
jgi:ATPase family associated with various cellular activities (AAA)